MNNRVLRIAAGLLFIAALCGAFYIMATFVREWWAFPACGLMWLFACYAAITVAEGKWWERL